MKNKLIIMGLAILMYGCSAFFMLVYLRFSLLRLNHIFIISGYTISGVYLVYN